VSTIAERVAAGAAFLDEHDPEWWRADVERAIDLVALNMESGRTCILGQRCPMETLTAYVGYTPDPDEPDDVDDLEFRYHAYAGHISGIGAGRAVREDMERWAVGHGFNRPFGGSRQEYDALTAEWKHVIAERRAEAVARAVTPGQEVSPPRDESDCCCGGTGEECPCEADGDDGLCSCCRNGDCNGACAAPGQEAQELDVQAENEADWKRADW
jgi:hypothetical protein